MANNLALKRVAQGFALVMDGDLLTTGAGQVIASRHRELMEEVLKEVEVSGSLDCSVVTFLVLQAFYLDEDRSSTPALARKAMARLHSDWFFERPADPSLLFPIMSMLGSIDVDRTQLPRALETLTPRQLAAILVCDAGLGSMLLGFKIVTTGTALPPLAMGSCDTYVAHLFGDVAEEGGGLLFGCTHTGRRTPTDADAQFCTKCCRARTLSRDFTSLCAMHRALDKVRRFAAFPEE